MLIIDFILRLFQLIIGKFIRPIGTAKSEQIRDAKNKIQTLLSSFSKDLEKFENERKDIIRRNGLYSSLMVNNGINTNKCNSIVNELISYRDKLGGKINMKEINSILHRINSIQDEFRKH